MKFFTFEEFKNIIKDISEHSNIYLVGAGRLGNIFAQYFTENHIKFKGFVDKNKTHSAYNDTILKYEDLKAEDKNYYFITSRQLRDSMYNSLQKKGISDEFIIESGYTEFYDYMFESVFNPSKYTKKLSILKDKYNGEKCFIIGNGPSLRTEDLDKLQNKKTFACNTIYPLYSHTKWRPTFYCAQDPSFCEAVLENNLFDLLKDNCQYLFFNIKTVVMEKYKDADIPSLFSYKAILMPENVTEFLEGEGETFYASGTIAFIMLQLAVYMGFKEIYLLGIDFTFSEEHHDNGSIVINDIVNHNLLIEQEEKLIISDIVKNNFGTTYYVDYDKQLRGYQAARKYADSHGIKIYNATRGGKLEVFERVDFDKIIEGGGTRV